jgi:glycosyltransferase involved in cell wall biosynthesis
MRILFLAPQPFYQERGTPIAVRMLLEILSQGGHQVDVVTYHEGETLTIPGVTFHRTPNFTFVRNIRPGFSIKKLFCDVFVLWKALSLASRHQYQLVHAVEESAFIGLLLKALFGLPFVYDMDSSIAQQMVEKYPVLRPVASVFHAAEGVPVRQAVVVIPVCDQLRDYAARHHPRKLVVLYDAPLLTPVSERPVEDVRHNLPPGCCLLMYVGNLEGYQGIDLLLEAFALAKAHVPKLELIIIGGQPAGIDEYERKVATLNLRVRFTGPKPVAHLADYLAQADILVSPRIRGSNTPMKLYSYMDSGKPILATSLSTHTQVLDSETAVLTDPTPTAYAAGMVKLANDAELCSRVGNGAKMLIATKYGYDRFHRTFSTLLDELEQHLRSQSGMVH